MNLASSKTDISYNKNALQIKAQLNDFYLANLNLKDFIELPFKYDYVNLLNTSFLVSYSFNNFQIQPFFSYNQLKTPKGDISIIEGKIEMPYLFTFGLNLGIQNHFITLGGGNGTACYFTRQSDDSYGKLLNAKQYFYNGAYSFNYSNAIIKSKTSINYIYLHGNFNCKMTDKNGPIFNPFKTFTFTGSDKLQALIMNENLSYSKSIFTFILNAGNYLILSETSPYSLYWNSKTDILSKIALKLLKLPSTKDTSTTHNAFSGMGILTAQLGLEIQCADNPEYKLYLSKYFALPYDIDLYSIKIPKNVENLKWLKAGFTFGFSFCF